MSVLGKIEEVVRAIHPQGLSWKVRDRIRIALNDSDHAEMLREMKNFQKITSPDPPAIFTKVKILGIQVVRDPEVEDL